jgi:Na+-translocating ferredoxin:NAD+ oxidoreductase subunit G
MSEKTHSPMTIGLRLFLICTVAALGLGLVNEITEPRIAAQRAANRQQVVETLVDKGRAGAPVAGRGGVEVYYAVVEGDAVLGYVLALNGTGYGGDLRLLAAYGTDGALRQARLVEDNETPGLGKKAENAEYMAMFTGTGGARTPVPVSKEMLAAGGAARPARAAVPWARMVQRGGLSGWLFGVASGPANPADAVTGATITFKGVSAALAEGAAFARGLEGRK